MRYQIEQRIETLAQNAVMKDGRIEATFSVGQVRYSHWDFDPNKGWPSDCWLAEASIEAENYKAAFRIFRQDLNRVVSRICAALLIERVGYTSRRPGRCRGPSSRGPEGSTIPGVWG